MKILLSWLAYNEDFIQMLDENDNRIRRTNQVNEVGPNFGIHKDIWDNYDKHILLNGTSSLDIGEVDNRYFEKFYDKLVFKYSNRVIEKKYIVLSSHIDLVDIKQKIDELLDALVDHEVDVFVSPGTGTMQAAWYLSSFGYENVDLFHVHWDKKSNKRKKVLVKADSSMVSKYMNISYPIVAQGINDDRSKSPSLSLAIKRVEQIVNFKGSNNKPDVLILGAHGTGKEGFARMIHDKSDRSAEVFRTVNCAALSDELLSSELFGHIKGAFTGANENKKGVFDVANNGTVFLDEIGDISVKMQVSLLRVLQEREFSKIGDLSSKPQKFDIRIVTATNKDLLQLCRDGKFRWDLYYRLKVTVISLPSLFDRGSNEVKSLIDFFNTKFSIDGNLLEFSKETMDRLLAYTYPGNVRELENIIWSLRVFSDTGKIELKDLPDEIVTPTEENSLLMEDVVRKHIVKVYRNGPKKPNGTTNMSKTAKILGISKRNLETKLERYGEWNGESS